MKLQVINWAGVEGMLLGVPLGILLMYWLFLRAGIYQDAQEIRSDDYVPRHRLPITGLRALPCPTVSIGLPEERPQTCMRTAGHDGAHDWWPKAWLVYGNC